LDVMVPVRRTPTHRPSPGKGACSKPCSSSRGGPRRANATLLGPSRSGSIRERPQPKALYPPSPTRPAAVERVEASGVTPVLVLRSQESEQGADPMSTDRIAMSKDGYEKLKARLDKMKNEEMPRIAEQIAEARGFGDLSENAEFHAAVEEQGMLQARINDLQNQ